MRDPHAMVNLILALHGEVRDEIVAATERHGLDRMASIDRDDEGDTIYAIDVIGETIVTRIAEALARERTFVMVAEGLPGGRRIYPSGADEASAGGAGGGGHRSLRGGVRPGGARPPRWLRIRARV